MLLGGCVSNNELYQVANSEQSMETVEGVEVAFRNDERTVNKGDYYNGIPRRLIKDSVYIDEVSYGPDSIHYLNVGAGLCCFAVNMGHVLMIGSGDESYESKVINYIDRLAPESLDIILPCMTDRTVANIPEVIERYHSIIGKIIIPPYNSAKNDEGNNILKKAEEYGIGVEVPDDGLLFDINGFSARVYRPYTSVPYSHTQAETVVALYSNGYQYLFEGNITAEKEENLLKYHDPDTGTHVECIFMNGETGEEHASVKWLGAFTPSYYMIGTTKGSYPKRIADYGSGVLTASAKGTVIFQNNGLFVDIRTNAPDKDNSAAYTEPEVIEETVPDKVVIIDDSGIVHDSINCEKFSGTNARSISLEEALASGKKMCSKCLSEYYE